MRKSQTKSSSIPRCLKGNEKDNVVLYVDDEVSNLKAFERLMRNQPFTLITCDSPSAALSQVQKIKPAVVISDQCMPEMNGTVFLEKVKNMHPDSVRMILTGRGDLKTAIESINQGHVFRFIQKPWDDEDLINQVESALEYQESIYWLRGVVDVLVDEIMENERAQKGLRRLAALVSVELNQPILIISAYVQLLREYFSADVLTQTYLSNIMNQIDRIGELADKSGAICKKLDSFMHRHDQAPQKIGKASN